MPEATALFKEWSGYLKPEDVARVEAAYHFSEAAHRGQLPIGMKPPLQRRRPNQYWRKQLLTKKFK